jgi:hypothetical protein
MILPLRAILTGDILREGEQVVSRISTGPMENPSHVVLHCGNGSIYEGGPNAMFLVDEISISEWEGLLHDRSR